MLGNVGHEENTGNTVNTHLRAIKMSHCWIFLLLFNFTTLRFTALRVILYKKEVFFFLFKGKEHTEHSKKLLRKKCLQRGPGISTKATNSLICV